MEVSGTVAAEENFLSVEESKTLFLSRVSPTTTMTDVTNFVTKGAKFRCN